MIAREPAEASTLFERYFADGDLEGLMSLYEEGAVFPTPHGTSTGHDEIRATLQAYLDSGAKLVFGESLVFSAGNLALIHTPWTMRMPDGSTPEGATAEVVRRQSDGSWKYIIDNPDGTALLDHE
jgi:ketosteroid isomerase-like protein